MSPAKRERPDSERRQKVRFDVQGLQGGVRLPMDARIVDLGFGGLGVETDHWLQVGRRYTVTLPGRGAPLRIAGTVAWCVLDRTVKTAASEAAPVYKAGIHFQDPDDRTVDAIERLLTTAAQVGLEDRIRGRFRYRRERTVDVELQHLFTVRKLSLTGMLVEADFLPEIDDEIRVALRVDDEPLEITARVAYVDPNLSADGDDGARIGLEFSQLGPDERRLLRGLIRSEVASSSALFVGNPQTSVFHRSDCRHAADCTVSYRSRRQAERDGLRAGACCLE